MEEESIESFIQVIKCPTFALMAKEGVYKDDISFVEQRVTEFPSIKLKWLEGIIIFTLNRIRVFQ